MTTFKIRDTDEGYELSYGGSAKVIITEKGGHGLLEKLYAIVERLSHAVKIPVSSDGAISKEDGIALIIACDEFKKAVAQDTRVISHIND